MQGNHILVLATSSTIAAAPTCAGASQAGGGGGGDAGAGDEDGDGDDDASGNDDDNAYEAGVDAVALQRILSAGQNVALPASRVSCSDTDRPPVPVCQVRCVLLSTTPTRLATHAARGCAQCSTCHRWFGCQETATRHEDKGIVTTRPGAPLWSMHSSWLSKVRWLS